jgi:hypothetical protein
MSNLEFRYDSYQEDVTQTESQKKKELEPPLANSFIKDSRYEEEFEEEEPGRPLPQPSNNRERLIEQNIKLKTQIYELAKQMD